MYQPAIILDEYEDSATRWTPPRPEDLPTLEGVSRISMDTENSGKNAFDDFVCGVSIGWRDPENLAAKSLYAPVGHIEGNMDPEIVKMWMEYVLPGKEIVFANGKYDIQIMRTGLKKKFGIDLEALGCKVRDVAFPAALLDDSPFADLSLDAIGIKYVGRGKERFPGDIDKMASYPSWMAGPYAEGDSLITLEADENMEPFIRQEGLENVLELENSLIYAVCEIERNGCRVHRPKLEQWRTEVRTDYEKILREIFQLTGFRVDPGTVDSMMKLFSFLGLEPPRKKQKRKTKGKGKNKEQPEEDEEENNQKRTFEVEELLSFNHPIFNLVVDARRQQSLLSRFLDKYYEALTWGHQNGNDLLRASFHQCKNNLEALKKKEKAKGTGWGRFSSSGGGDLKSGYSFNAQQVIRADKQEAELGDAHIIRELFIPDDGMEYFSADMKQVEYRIYAALAGAKTVIKAYREDANTDYHALLHDRIRPYKPHIQRTIVKNVSFAYAYNSSPQTLAATAGVTIKEAEEIYEFCKQLMPERDGFIKKCAHDAEHKGYVATIMGRRARFKPSDPFYRAVSRIVQGSAADIFKLALRDLYRERKTLGIHKLRQVVHDEIDGDKEPGEVYTKRILDFLDEQRFDLAIPIRWDLHTGVNWRECK